MSENRQSNSTFSLISVESKRKLRIVAGRLKDVVAGLSRQARSDAAALNTMQDRLHQLHPQYREYIELVDKLKQTEERAQVSLGMLFGVNSLDYKEIAASFEELDSAGSFSIPDVTSLPLWKLIREMLRQVPEMQIIDVERMMKQLGVETGRTAIDSAIATHRDIFTVRKRGREKYISLKGV